MSTATSTTKDSPKYQEAVPELIRQLYLANIELVKPSVGPAFAVANDPHLRLRRTLTPSVNQGWSSVTEAQFMIPNTTGERLSLRFSVDLNDHTEDFTMEAFAWGASEETATCRVVALHGITPGVSRLRWHHLGERLSKSQPNTRFVALDWHSIDRTIEKYQTAFLTLLPKHFHFSPSLDRSAAFIEQLSTPEDKEKFKKMFDTLLAECPRPLSEATEVFRSVIEQGLGWGVKSNKPFVLGIKSWSGCVGMNLLANSGESFRAGVKGLVALHPACYDSNREQCQMVVAKIPTLLGWSVDDQKAPYFMSEWFVGPSHVKLVTYETGGHHNFDGTNGLPNFDDEIEKWLAALT